MAKNYELGKVVQIELINGKYGYGLVLEEPLVAFSENVFDEPQSDFDVLFYSSTFSLWVMKSALGKTGWTKVSKIENHPLMGQEHKFYKFDAISKKFSIYSGGVEIPATKTECLDLECAAVWSREHVEDRLLAINENRECIWKTTLSAHARV
ncbi:hypothetical protein [Vibrio bathopelagicus]|uniref:hypothetical protein n=1 Tax=Vibrio bathopelagicus TaxID=2777577 RepID=UPI0018643873|nr:hypothetical protein [Vibrio bathopelagicus]